MQNSPGAFKILMKHVAPEDEKSTLLRLEGEPPLMSIAFAWTKAATNKINLSRRLSRQAQGSSASSSAAPAALAFVPSTEAEPAPAAAAKTDVSDSDSDDPEPFAWTKTPDPSTGSASANPPELATVFDGSVWKLLEGKINLLDDEVAAKKTALNSDDLREAIKEASAQTVDDLVATAASSSAAAASSSPAALPELVDITPWENNANFQFGLKFLAWMRRKDGSPRPVFIEPETVDEFPDID
jgi:hypothetical protein